MIIFIEKVSDKIQYWLLIKNKDPPQNIVANVSWEMSAQTLHQRCPDWKMWN